jgi:hypothetical protein
MDTEVTNRTDTASETARMRMLREVESEPAYGEIRVAVDDSLIRALIVARDFLRDANYRGEYLELESLLLQARLMQHSVRG